VVRPADHALYCRQSQPGVPGCPAGGRPGNTHDSTQISVEAPRGGLLAFVTIEPLPSGDSHVTIYNGDLYWPDAHQRRVPGLPARQLASHRARVAACVDKAA